MSYQPISTQSYATPDEAAMGGFLKVQGNNGYEKIEYAFWVVLKVKNGKKLYHYTEPQTDNTPHGVSITIPHGHILRGYCHTHPDNIITGEYSWQDKQQFTELAKKQYQLTFYMMNRYNEIRVAHTADDLVKGKTIPWKAVKA